MGLIGIRNVRGLQVGVNRILILGLRNAPPEQAGSRPLHVSNHNVAACIRLPGDRLLAFQCNAVRCVRNGTPEAVEEADAKDGEHAFTGGAGAQAMVEPASEKIRRFLEQSALVRQMRRAALLPVRPEALLASAAILLHSRARPAPRNYTRARSEQQHHDSPVGTVSLIPRVFALRLRIPLLLLPREEENGIELTAALAIPFAARIGVSGQEIIHWIQLQIVAAKQIHVLAEQFGAGLRIRLPTLGEAVRLLELGNGVKGFR